MNFWQSWTSIWAHCCAPNIILLVTSAPSPWIMLLLTNRRSFIVSWKQTEELKGSKLKGVMKGSSHHRKKIFKVMKRLSIEMHFQKIADRDHSPRNCYVTLKMLNFDTNTQSWNLWQYQKCFSKHEENFPRQKWLMVLEEIYVKGLCKELLFKAP